MAKSNHYLSTSPELGSRGQISVVHSSKRKRPNALKHGLHATAAIIPGEDPDEFEQLYAELIKEWKPLGPTLRDAVFDLADLKWRKRRLTKSVQTQLWINTFDPDHPAFDERTGLGIFLHYLRSEPETCLGVSARKCLRADKINYLKQKCPRSNYQSTSEWVEAVTREILSILFPATSGFEPSEPEAEIAGLKEATREWKADCKMAGSIAYARELLDWESTERERLDARINRQIKFLFELKSHGKNPLRNLAFLAAIFLQPTLDTSNRCARIFVAYKPS
jgi:hypothetical protein